MPTAVPGGAMWGWLLRGKFFKAVSVRKSQVSLEMNGVSPHFRSELDVVSLADRLHSCGQSKEAHFGPHIRQGAVEEP